MKILNGLESNNKPLEEKYKVLVEDIEEERTIRGKIDKVAALLFMLINNDLSCSEKRQKLMMKKLNKLYILFIVLAALFLFFNPESLKLVLKIIQTVV